MFYSVILVGACDSQKSCMWGMAEQKSKSDLLWTYSWLILALDIYIYIAPCV